MDEQLPASRVVVGGLDRTDAVAADVPLAVARRGAFVTLDHVGLNDDDTYVTDRRGTRLRGRPHAGAVTVLHVNARLPDALRP